MKKRSFLFLCTVALCATIIGFNSCKPNEEPENVNVEFTLNQTSISKAIFGEPLLLSGSVKADKSITALTFTSVKKEGDNYTALGEGQPCKVNGGTTENFNMEFFVDNKAMTHIEVKATSGTASKSDYIAVNSVEGEAKGTAYINDQVILRADTMVWNNENHPDEYPNPNTGAKSTTPSFFSIQGVEINGATKHVLSIDEVRSVGGKDVSFSFINVLQNTANGVYIGGQRGYMFQNLVNLSGGTIGRQCDMYEIDGKVIDKANAEKTQFKIIAGSWMGSGWNEARFKLVDSIFVALGNEATSEAQKLRAYYLLSKIQTRLDNATLGESNAPTSLAPLDYARRRTDAGQTATNAMVENFRAGDYILLRTERTGKSGEPTYYYGIMQITQMEDDSKYFAETDNGTKIDRDQAHNLFLKPLILNVKVQAAL